MTHQVLHGREELFGKVRQAAEGGADLRLSVWVTVDRQLLHRVDVLLQVRHVVWRREGGTVRTGSDVCVFLYVCFFECIPCPDVYLALAAFFIFCNTNRSLSRTWTQSTQWESAKSVCVVCVCVSMVVFVCSCRACWDALIHLLTQHTHTEDELCSLTTGSYIPVWVSSV